MSENNHNNQKNSTPRSTQDHKDEIDPHTHMTGGVLDEDWVIDDDI